MALFSLPRQITRIQQHSHKRGRNYPRFSCLLCRISSSKGTARLFHWDNRASNAVDIVAYKDHSSPPNFNFFCYLSHIPAAAMSDGIHVVTGLWTNWSPGRILGATLTLPQKYGGLLLTFLAVYVAFAGSMFWRFLAFILHQINTTGPGMIQTLHIGEGDSLTYRL